MQRVVLFLVPWLLKVREHQGLGLATSHTPVALSQGLLSFFLYLEFLRGRMQFQLQILDFLGTTLVLSPIFVNEMVKFVILSLSVAGLLHLAAVVGSVLALDALQVKLLVLRSVRLSRLLLVIA